MDLKAGVQFLPSTVAGHMAAVRTVADRMAAAHTVAVRTVADPTAADHTVADADSRFRVT